MRGRRRQRPTPRALNHAAAAFLNTLAWGAVAGAFIWLCVRVFTR